jgi:hypothetical protein
VVALTVAGCGQSAADQVRAKIEQLAHEAASRNYQAICSQVLAPSLVARLVSNGIPCSEGLQVALGSVHNPVINVGKITVSGQKAKAIILASARGQQAEVSALALQDTGQGWRISSLSSSLAAAARHAAHGGGGTGTTGS